MAVNPDKFKSPMFNQAVKPLAKDKSSKPEVKVKSEEQVVPTKVYSEQPLEVDGVNLTQPTFEETIPEVEKQDPSRWVVAIPKSELNFAWNGEDLLDTKKIFKLFKDYLSNPNNVLLGQITPKTNPDKSLYVMAKETKSISVVKEIKRHQETKPINVGIQILDISMKDEGLMVKVTPYGKNAKLAEIMLESNEARCYPRLIYLTDLSLSVETFDLGYEFPNI